MRNLRFESLSRVVGTLNHEIHIFLILIVKCTIMIFTHIYIYGENPCNAMSCIQEVDTENSPSMQTSSPTFCVTANGL